MELTSYNAARKALQVCATVDEAKDILDKAEALRAYARQQNNSEMEYWLAEMKLRARRRIGEISQELEKAPRGGPGGTSKLPTTGKFETLKSAGLTTSVAQRCEKIAVILRHKMPPKTLLYMLLKPESFYSKPRRKCLMGSG